MRYTDIQPGIFLNRPNRFIATVELDGKSQTVHVKNTGRCAELLIPGTAVYVQDFGNQPKRKTRYDLIAVNKLEKQKQKLVNMDSQAPNKVVIEALQHGMLQLPGFEGDYRIIKPEQRFGDSRFDVYVEGCGERAFIEVKGVTLELDGTARFPDAPTQRGLKHVNELIQAKKNGFLAYIIFVIQMSDVRLFEPNYATHAAFGEALKAAQTEGVEVLAFDCQVTPEELWLGQSVPIRL